MNQTTKKNTVSDNNISRKNTLKEFLALFPTRYYKKGAIILSPETVEVHIKYLIKGIVREFYVTDKRDINLDFYEQTEYLTDCVSLQNSIASSKWQECITDVEMKAIPKDRFDAFLATHEGADVAFRTTFLGLLAQRETRERSRLTQSVEELYQNLLRDKPSWIQNIPQYHIASYLGVSPETLSRIRKRIS